MRPHSTIGSSRRAAAWSPALAALSLAALMSVPVPACFAAEAPGAHTWDGDSGANGRLWWSIGAQGGWVRPDAKLANYQWETTSSSAWGIRVLAGTGGFSGGARSWNTRAEQVIGAAGTPSVVSVRGTSWEVVGRGRLARLGGNDVLAIASAGRLHLGYEPGRVTIMGQSGNPIVAELASIDEWITGGGLALERKISGVWKVGIEVERRLYGLDAAHREGEAIVERRESLGDWNARVELARLRASR